MDSKKPQELGNTSVKGTQIDALMSKFTSVALLGILSGTWFVAVVNNVPEPYLDEYFHVRQALEYWKGRWHVWDPKITTPPGLYVAAWAWLFLLRWTRIPFAALAQLRALNSFLGIPLIWQRTPGLLAAVYEQELGIAARDVSLEDGGELAAGIWATTRALAFFPPLFFFSALFYTDVLSVLLVLACYGCFLDSGNARGGALGRWLVLPLGVLALLFRQNNIFWCAVYLAGLEVLRSLKTDERTVLLSWSDIPVIVQSSWSDGTFYNPTVDLAGVEVITLAVAAVVSLPRLIPRLMPYVALLGLFGAFILWNGGVVLGDKSNHVASLHLPQMLYIWAYFAFFSFPVLLLGLFSKIMASKKLLLTSLPRPLVLIAATALGFLAVHFNTIIHPFTLADNRHYTFYVFRLLRIYPFLRYYAVHIYVICAWLAITALGTANGTATGLAALTKSSTTSTSNQSSASKKKPRVRGSAVASAAASTASSATAVQYPKPAPGSNRAGFVVVWLISSALGLVTAPLVEPRYFILPWIFWRLHVPPTQLMIPETKSKEEREAAGQKAIRWLVKHTPMLETSWMLLINAVTMYIFLYWSFEWPQERGAIQRFMW